MIALFARANHPHNGWTIPHGYVVIGVRCSTLDELQGVREAIWKRGLRLPDDYRVQNVEGQIDWSQHEWYSGGMGAWDYLGTISGEMIDGLPSQEPWGGSKGDNRFFNVYNALDVLVD